MTSNRFFRKVCLIVGFLVVLNFFAVSSSYAFTTLWYNGDFNFDDEVNSNGLANEINTEITQSNIYDDFIVNGTGWNVSTIWSNNLMTFTGVTEAMWEIRSGISSGSGGTLIAGSTGSATQTATGRSGFSFDEYRIEVSGLNVNLTPGRYWLTVAPVAVNPGSGRSFCSTTIGLNAIGSPAGNNQNAYWDSTHFGYDFALTSDIDSRWVYDFSMGVGGENAVIPEPASLMLLGMGLLGFGAARRKKRII